MTDNSVSPIACEVKWGSHSSFEISPGASTTREGWHVRDQHNAGKTLERRRQDIAEYARPRRLPRPSTAASGLLTHRGEFLDQPIIVHHYQRPLVVSQSRVGPAVVPHQSRIGRQRNRIRGAEPDQSRLAPAKVRHRARTPAIEP